MDVFALTSSNLVSPPILFFILGLAAALFRSDLSIPESVAKGLSLYLVMAIGFKGGAEMAAGGLSGDILLVLFTGILLSALIPFLGFFLLQTTTGLRRVDAAAVAAHYGSISIVTFIAANDAGMFLGLPGDGHMVAVAAAMEAPAILTGLLLAGAAGRATGAASEGGGLIREIMLNGSIVLLLGGFAIGWATGASGMAAVEPFFVDIFRGVLCLFLLDMGLIAGSGLLKNARDLQPTVVAFGVYMALIGAALALGASALIGLSAANAALLMTLAASASYIAVPAALRLALPQARSAISLTLSLGVTFPFNLVIGIPLYFWAARATLGG